MTVMSNSSFVPVRTSNVVFGPCACPPPALRAWPWPGRAKAFSSASSQSTTSAWSFTRRSHSCAAAPAGPDGFTTATLAAKGYEMNGLVTRTVYKKFHVKHRSMKLALANMLANIPAEYAAAAAGPRARAEHARRRGPGRDRRTSGVDPAGGSRRPVAPPRRQPRLAAQPWRAFLATSLPLAGGLEISSPRSRRAFDCAVHQRRRRCPLFPR